MPGTGRALPSDSPQSQPELQTRSRQGGSEDAVGVPCRAVSVLLGPRDPGAIWQALHNQQRAQLYQALKLRGQGVLQGDGVDELPVLLVLRYDRLPRPRLVSPTAPLRI
jgi:hypothetical protein